MFEELDEKLPPGRPTTLGSTSYSNRNSLSIPLPPFSQRVEITQTQIPANARTQYGGDSAPGIIFSGWISFSPSEGGGLRERIDYEECSFLVPEGARWLTITLYEGHRANIRITYVEGAQ